MNNIVQQLTSQPQAARRVSSQEYSAWRHSYIFDALRGLRFGQSFCNHFDITDYRIMFCSDADRAEHIIKQEWLVSA